MMSHGTLTINCVSNHITGDRTKFVQIDKNVPANVRFGDDTKVEIKGKVTVNLATNNGDHKNLHNVYHVTRKKNNTLSIDQLLGSGYKVKMEDKYLLLRNRGNESGSVQELDGSVKNH
ncbi:UNVERIFIED_CONTAM: hypothetical protein Slati_2374100 [Sesamum latifolium]|uniref:Retrovirus-related Pol polyprotein from transposon TNT 1-94-like beta-barrel domain-containing protein n=1 Tax=Sesamum latifolium TaxID=2727402 RepID=A0AAW2WG72_9LAMI